jgi:DNA-binding response OmpR family regulator
MRLLVIEDNVALAWRLQAHLEKYFMIKVVRSGTEGLRLAETSRYDAILLDLGLPDVSGEQICISLRANNIVTPILVISGTDEVNTRVRLLDNGADDYLAKPFDIFELRARVQALLRRQQVVSTPDLLRIDDLVVDMQQRKVERGGTLIKLRRKEYDILEYLLRNRGKIITQTKLLNHVWDEWDSTMWKSSVRVHIKNLRDKVDRPFAKPLIKTTRGIGYTIDDR